jgi:hypothetical protein
MSTLDPTIVSYQESIASRFSSYANCNEGVGDETENSHSRHDLELDLAREGSNEGVGNDSEDSYSDDDDEFAIMDARFNRLSRSSASFQF